MKVAVVAPTFLPARRANTIQVMKMAQALTQLGHTLRLAVPGIPPQPLTWDELAQHYGLRHKFTVEWLPAWRPLRRYDYGYQAVRWARRWGAEVLYTRLPQAAAMASQLGMATIFEVHDLPQGTLGPMLFRLFLKGRGARRLVVISRALARDLAQRLGIPETPPFTLIAPDGVDLERYEHLPAPSQARQMLATKCGLSLPVERFTVGFTGHLYPGRGVELIANLAAHLPEMTFLVVGGEPQDVQRWRDEVKSRRSMNLILTGFVPNAELPLYQAACDVLLMPYQRRVAASSGGDIASYLSPMKLFEYMACGRAILASDLTVFREVLTPEMARLLPPADEDAWVGALRGLQADPAERARLGEAARRQVGRYTWEERARRILQGLEV